jgi:hypothetical protein
LELSYLDERRKRSLQHDITEHTAALGASG